MRLIDTHAHLNDARFRSDLDDVISRAGEAGVEAIVVCGYDLESSRSAIQISEKYSCVFATVGIHPHDAKHYNDEARQELVELSRHNKVLAIGETGLDFHYNFSPQEDQLAAFRAQIELAIDVGLPIVIHSRESDSEVLKILRSYQGNLPPCVFHFFSGNIDTAREVLDVGCYIGVDGPITFKKSEEMRDVAKMAPLDRILVETDCPYLTPVPFRGKRNEPAYIAYVAEALAAIKGISVQDLAEATTRNAIAFFGDTLAGGNE